MPFDDYSKYKDEYEPERVRRIPRYSEEGLYKNQYLDEDRELEEEFEEEQEKNRRELGEDIYPDWDPEEDE